MSSIVLKRNIPVRALMPMMLSGESSILAGHIPIRRKFANVRMTSKKFFIQSATIYRFLQAIVFIAAP